MVGIVGEERDGVVPELFIDVVVEECLRCWRYGSHWGEPSIRLVWCEERGIRELADVQAFHVAAFLKDLQGELSAPTVKQHLAALRMLFDWLVTGHILEVNPAHAVRGPKYVVKKGKTPVLSADEASTLLDSIDASSLIGLRDHAFIWSLLRADQRGSLNEG